MLSCSAPTRAGLVWCRLTPASHSSGTSALQSVDEGTRPDGDKSLRCPCAGTRSRAPMGGRGGEMAVFHLDHRPRNLSARVPAWFTVNSSRPSEPRMPRDFAGRHPSTTSMSLPIWVFTFPSSPFSSSLSPEAQLCHGRSWFASSLGRAVGVCACQEPKLRPLRHERKGLPARSGEKRPHLLPLAWECSISTVTSLCSARQTTATLEA